MAFLAHWATLLAYPSFVCGAIYGVQRLLKRPFYWQ